MAAPGKIQVTKNYSLFQFTDENRNLDIKKHSRLKKSMQKYGFIEGYPIVVVRNADKQLIVKDGQHRLAIAETLGLAVYWIEVDKDFDIATINNTQKTWCIRDYADTFVNRGHKQYSVLLEFCDRYRIPVALGACLLAGTVTFTNISNQFMAGQFKIKEPQRAEDVASMYVAFVAMDKRICNVRLVEALVAVSRVDGFDKKRMLSNLDYCKDKLFQYSSRDGYLDMLEAIYNYKRMKLVPLKINAVTVMRERSAAENKHHKSLALSAKPSA